VHLYHYHFRWQLRIGRIYNDLLLRNTYKEVLLYRNFFKTRIAPGTHLGWWFHAERNCT